MPLLLFLLLLPGLAASQALPACNAAREGVVACIGDRMCACHWAPAGSITGRPAGLRWDCGPFRPQCDVAPPGPNAGEALPPVLLQPPWPTGR